MDYVIVENALSAPLLQRVQQAMAQGPFDDGKATASGLAQAVKHNLQLSQAVHGELLDQVRGELGAQGVLRSFAMPRQMGRPILNRYDTGMAYGMHVDGAYIADMRTDVSYTLFLSDPASYDGGELVVNLGSQQVAFKLPMGSMVLYPTQAVHAVNPVRRGVRYGLVGWIQSRVREPEQRAILAKLNTLTHHLRESQQQPLALLANECAQNLTRMWGD